MLAAVVVNLYTEYNHRADSGDDISYYQRPVVESNALNNEKYAAEAEHAECGECYAVGVARTDSDDSLGQIAEYHADTGRVADNVYYKVAHR